jgi:DNA-binding MarR family transcriptional regulator
VSSPTGTQVDATRLFVVLGRVTRAVRRDAPVVDVGHGALSLLSLLTKEGPQRLGALAGAEGVSPPSMTRIVTSLEELDLVRRTPDPEDGRASLVEATRAGEQLVATGKGLRLAALAARIERLDPEALDALQAALPALEQLAQD